MFQVINCLDLASSFESLPSCGTERDRYDSLYHHLSRLGRLLYPAPVLLDEINQTINGFGFGDIELYRRLTDIQIDFPRGATNIAEISVSHFARSVHDTAHDRDLDAFQMRGRGFDPSRGGLKIE